MRKLASTYRNKDDGGTTGSSRGDLRALGAEHLDTLTIMGGDLASTYRKQGPWEEGEELEVQVLETRFWLLGG